MAGICADVVTCVNVIMYAGACLNAPATSLVVLKVLAELCASWATSLGHSFDSSNNSPLLTLSVLSMACVACSLSQAAAPSLSRAWRDPGLQSFRLLTHMFLNDSFLKRSDDTRPVMKMVIISGRGDGGGK